MSTAFSLLLGPTQPHNFSCPQHSHCYWGPPSPMFTLTRRFFPVLRATYHLPLPSSYTNQCSCTFSPPMCLHRCNFTFPYVNFTTSFLTLCRLYQLIYCILTGSVSGVKRWGLLVVMTRTKCRRKRT